MREPESVRLIAPAKLTLSLRITGVRNGGIHDGFHEIDATMVSLDLCDELILTPGKDVSVTVTDSVIPYSPGPAVTGPIVTDTLVQDAMKLAKMSGYVELRKQIPAQAGLGGGSSDAAAILRWANSLIGKRRKRRKGRKRPYSAVFLGTPVSVPISVKAACQIGADVGFCLTGGRARVRGIGEKVEQLRYKREKYTLLLPPFGLATQKVYRAWDQLTSSDQHSSDLHSPDPAILHVNDLEQAAISIEPKLLKWRDALAEQTNQKPTLAGSGSGWFVKGHYPDVLFEEISGLPVTTTRQVDAN